MQVHKSTIEFDSASDLTDVFNAENLAILAEDAKTRALAHEFTRWLDELEAAGISRANFLRAIAHTFERQPEIWEHLAGAADTAYLHRNKEK